jgi:CRISPR/Cas system-associated endoribonuclease Cas2
MNEQQLVEIEKRAHRLSRQHQQDVFILLLAIRSLKAEGEGRQVVSRAELLMIIAGYERKMKNLRRNLSRVIENLGSEIEATGLRRNLQRIVENIDNLKPDN